MGRLRPVAAAAVLACAGWLTHAGTAVGFDGFGTPEADATFGDELVFSVELAGDAPERLELLLWFGDSETVFVAPVTPEAGQATFRWDAARDFVVPNTPIRYRWRAIDGGRETLSREGELRYDDDRSGLDWERATIAEATVHWYGDAGGAARRLGELTAAGARRAEELLGHELSGPVDLFVYETRNDFFGALGPGAREWTGAATYPALRTIFMYLQGSDTSFLERTLVHEVTHVVFHDATDNPFHQPARWVNEGIARWSEEEGAAREREIVRAEARAGGVLAFDGIADVFPIGDRASSLAYAQSASIIDMIIADHGTEAIARLATAYQDGATDAEALEAATGRAPAELFEAFYAAFGTQPPARIAARPILPSIVDVPRLDEPGQVPGATPSPVPGPAGPADAWIWLPIVVLLAAALAVAGSLVWRRRGAGARS